MPTPLQLQSWLPALLEPFQVRTRQQQQNLHFHLVEPLPTIQTDISSLERVISELLHNACKYTPPGETITVTATVTAQGIVNVSMPQESDADAPIAVQITVSNSGTEIPPTEYDRIFEKFYRIPKNDPWKHGGTGLGLALVQKLVEHLHGTIAVHSTNQQVDFVVTLPIDWAEQKGN